MTWGSAVAVWQDRTGGYLRRPDGSTLLAGPVNPTLAYRAEAAKREAAEALLYPAVYFDPSLGADTGNGTPTSPYRDVTAARLLPGRRHLIKAGTTVSVSAGASSVWVSTSTTGYAKAPVIIGMYGGTTRPIIDCSAAQRGIRFGNGVKYWRVRDLDIIGGGAGADRYAISQSTADATTDSTTTFGHVIERCRIRTVQTDSSTDCNGIKVYGADWEILDCEIYDIATDGIWAHGYRTLIQGCDIYKVAQDNRNDGDCIQFGARSDGSIVRGCRLDHSDKDYKQCVYFEQTVSVSDAVTIEDCIAIGYDGTAGSHTPIHCGATNSVVRRCYVSGGIQGILVGEGSLAHHNVVIATAGRGIELKIDSAAYHNTIVQTGAQSGQTLSCGIRNASATDTGSVARNNVILGFANSILCSVSGATPVTAESHNAFYTTGGTPAHYRVNGTITTPTSAVTGASIAALGLNTTTYRPEAGAALLTAATPVALAVARDRDFNVIGAGLTCGAFGL